MRIAPWSNTAAAPSELHKRPEATSDVLDALGVECDPLHVQTFIDHDWMGDIIIQSKVGGWSQGGWRYHPQMQMSYWSGADMVIWSQANATVLASGRVTRMQCGDEVVHLAHWPVCNNLSRVYPRSESLPEMPIIEHPVPWLEQPLPPVIPEEHVHTVPEPGTLALFLLGVSALFLIKKMKGRTHEN